MPTKHNPEKKSDGLDQDVVQVTKKILYDRELVKTLEEKSHRVKTLLIAPKQYAIEPTLPKAVRPHPRSGWLDGCEQPQGLPLLNFS